MRICAPLCIIALLAGCSSSSSKTLPGGGGAAGATSGGGQGGSAAGVSGGAAGTGGGAAGSGGGAAGSGGVVAIGGTGGVVGGSGGVGVGGTAGSGGSTGGTGGTAGSGGGLSVPDLAGCGIKTSDVPQPTLYSALDSTADVTGTTPPGAESGNVNYVGSVKCVSAMSVVDVSGIYVVWSASVLDFTKGTLAFWLKPDWDHGDSKVHNLVSTSGLGSLEGGMGVRKKADGDFVVEFSTSGQSYSKTLGKLDYTLTKNVWTHIVINWDINVTPVVNVFIGGKKDVAVPIGTFPTTIAPGSKLRLGSTGGVSTDADAQYDDLKIYNVPIAP